MIPRLLLLAALAGMLSAQVQTITGEVRDPSLDAGIAGARVELVEYSTVGGEEVRTILASTFTGATGEFELRAPRPGPFYVSVRKDGYVGAYADSVTDSERPVTVQPSSQARLSFVMTRPGTITGRVVDEDGQPIHGVRVAIQSDTAYPPAYAESDPDGVFTAEGLPPAGYSLRFGPESRDPAALPFDDDAFAVTDRDLVHTVWPTLGAPRAQVTSGGVVNVGTITARSVEYYRAHVTVRGAECGNGETWQFTAGAREFMTGGPPRSPIPCDGEFMVANLSPGTYWFALWSRSQWALDQVNVTRENTEVQLTASPAGEAAGRVVFAEGTATTALDRIVIDLAPTVSMLPRTHQTSRVDTDGNFRLRGVMWPNHRLTVAGVPPGYYVKEIRSGGQPLGNLTITPIPGAPSTIEIVIDDKTASLIGTAMRDGRPAAGAMIQIMPASPSEIRFIRLPGRSGADGRFEIRGLAPGDYRASALDTVTASQPGAVLAPGPEIAVHLEAGETRNITLELPRR